MERLPRRFHSAGVLGALLGAIGLLASGQPARAHKHSCTHSHNSPSVSFCNVPGATCDTTGKCTQEVDQTHSWCECVLPAPPGRGCLSKKQTSFQGVPGGLPSADATVTYTAVADPGNFLSLLRLDGAVIQYFGPGGTDLQGSVTLHYGSFSNPNAVPIEILSLSLTAPGVLINGSPTGTNSIHLPAGPTQSLVYDSTTGLIETLDASGIALEIDNNLVSGQPTTLYLEAQVQSGGALLFGQGIALFPASVPSVSPGAVVLLGVLLLTAAAIVLRMRTWARSRV